MIAGPKNRKKNAKTDIAKIKNMRRYLCGTPSAPALNQRLSAFAILAKELFLT
jgi:hypothetical protein